MPGIIKCEVCGKLFNESYVGSHQRLAHGKKISSDAKVADEPGAIDEILSLYNQLSNKCRRELLDRLTALSEKTH